MPAHHPLQLDCLYISCSRAEMVDAASVGGEQRDNVCVIVDAPVLNLM